MGNKSSFHNEVEDLYAKSHENNHIYDKEYIKRQIKSLSKAGDCSYSFTYLQKQLFNSLEKDSDFHGFLHIDLPSTNYGV